MRNIICILTIMFLFIGCSQKVQIKALKAAKITNKSIKNIAVLSFRNDEISQSIQINSAISNVNVNNKKYFTLVDKKDIDKILKEQKLNDSGLVNIFKNSSSNGLSQIETLVMGEVMVDDMTRTFFQESRTDYNRCIKTYKSKGEEYCSKYRKYKVPCQANTYNVKTEVKLIQVNNGKTIFTNTYAKSSKYKHCSDDAYTLPNKTTENNRLAYNIAHDLVKDIAPSYVYFSITLLEDIDIDLTNTQEILFENALEMIQYKRINKANKMLLELNKQLASRSYVVLYNLAITEESLGNITRAYEFLKEAEDVSLQSQGVVEEIIIYVKKIEQNLSEKRKVNKQL